MQEQIRLRQPSSANREKEGCAAGGWDYNKGVVLKASFAEGTDVTFRVSGEAINACVESEYQAETSNTGDEGVAPTGSVGKLIPEICNPLMTKVPETATTAPRLSLRHSHRGMMTTVDVHTKLEGKEVPEVTVLREDHRHSGLLAGPEAPALRLGAAGD